MLVPLRALLSVLSKKDCCPTIDTITAIKFLMGQHRPSNTEEAYCLARNAILEQFPYLLDVDPDCAGPTTIHVDTWAKQQEAMYGLALEVRPMDVSDTIPGVRSEYSDGYSDEPGDWEPEPPFEDFC